MVACGCSPLTDEHLRQDSHLLKVDFRLQMDPQIRCFEVSTFKLLQGLLLGLDQRILTEPTQSQFNARELNLNWDNPTQVQIEAAQIQRIAKKPLASSLAMLLHLLQQYPFLFITNFIANKIKFKFNL